MGLKGSNYRNSKSCKNFDQRRVSEARICYIASSPKAGSVTSSLNDQGVYVLEHPPCSPDLASCDFFSMFPRLKKKLASRQYTSLQKLDAVIFNFPGDKPEKD